MSQYLCPFSLSRDIFILGIPSDLINFDIWNSEGKLICFITLFEIGDLKLCLQKKTICFIPYIGLVGIIIILTICWCITYYALLKGKYTFYAGISLILLWLHHWLSACCLRWDLKSVTVPKEVEKNLNCAELREADIYYTLVKE